MVQGEEYTGEDALIKDLSTHYHLNKLISLLKTAFLKMHCIQTYYDGLQFH